MAEWSNEMWLGVGIVIALCVITILAVLARLAGYAKELHDIRVRVAALRMEYAQRLAELAGGASAATPPSEGSGERRPEKRAA